MWSWASHSWSQVLATCFLTQSKRILSAAAAVAPCLIARCPLAVLCKDRRSERVRPVMLSLGHVWADFPCVDARQKAHRRTACRILLASYKAKVESLLRLLNTPDPDTNVTVQTPRRFGARRSGEPATWLPIRVVADAFRCSRPFSFGSRESRNLRRHSGPPARPNFELFSFCIAAVWRVFADHSDLCRRSWPKSHLA